MIGSVNCSSGGTDSRVDELFEEHRIRVTLTGTFYNEYVYEVVVGVNDNRYTEATSFYTTATMLDPIKLRIYGSVGSGYHVLVYINNKLQDSFTMNSIVYYTIKPINITNINISCGDIDTTKKELPVYITTT